MFIWVLCFCIFYDYIIRIIWYIMIKDIIVMFLLVVNIFVGILAYDAFYLQQQQLNMVKKECKSLKLDH